MHIRPYTPADWDVVCDIWNRGKPNELRGACDLRAIVPLERDSHMQQLFQASTVFVAEDHSRIVGFAGFKDATVTWLFVDSQCFRRSYGTALLAFILDRIGPMARLTVGVENNAAIALYEKLGFTMTKRFMGSHNEHLISALEMVRRAAVWPREDNGTASAAAQSSEQRG